MERRALQIINAALALATIGLGALQLLAGSASPVYADLALPTSPLLDSNLRFFGGLALGIGITLLLITPRIERYSMLFTTCWACAFLGGVGRALSWASMGTPSLPLAAFTVIEVLGAPALIVWQRRVARTSSPLPAHAAGA
jgi:hypothetical protein